jgi:hypothetical protein
MADTLERHPSQPEDARSDAGRVAAIDVDQPTEGVLHRDREGVGADVAGELHARVDLPSHRRAADRLEPGRQLVVVLRRRATGSRPHDDLAGRPRRLEVDLLRLDRLLGGDGLCRSCAGRRRRSGPPRRRRSEDRRGGQKAVEGVIEIGERLLALVGWTVADGVEVVLGVDDQAIEEREGGLLVRPEELHVRVGAATVCDRPDRGLELSSVDHAAVPGAGERAGRSPVAPAPCEVVPRIPADPGGVLRVGRHRPVRSWLAGRHGTRCEASPDGSEWSDSTNLSRSRLSGDAHRGWRAR